jgi:hypothetical protein
LPRLCHENVTESAHKEEMQFRGHARDLPLPALLGILHEQRRDCDVRLASDGGDAGGYLEGRLVVRGGALVHAALGGTRGLLAFQAASAREELVYEVVTPVGPVERTIHASQAELSALARRAEHAAGASSEAVAQARFTALEAERARASRTLGHVALGAAVFLAALTLWLRPTSHAEGMRGAVVTVEGRP